jgi:hypothetical protein
MPRSDAHETLKTYEADLADAERRLTDVGQEVAALRKVVEGMRELLRRERSPKSALPLFDTETPDEPTPDQPADGFVPRGSDAVARVLIERRTPTRVTELIEDMRQRGWLSADAKHPEAAVRAALQRLVKSAEVERVSQGVYRYRLDKLPPPEVPAPNGEVDS